MSTVTGADRTSPIIVSGVDANTAQTNETPLLHEPDVVRQGDVPQQGPSSWSPFRGVLIQGAAMAAIVVLSLPLMTGCGMADAPREPTPVEATQSGQAQQTSTTLRGQFVEAPSPGGEQAGIWLKPLEGQAHFEIDGHKYERLYVGVAETSSTDGLTPGGVGDLSGTVLLKKDGDTVIGVIDGIDAVVPGLPRDMQGTVQRGVAPGGAPGSEPTDFFLALDTPVWLNGKRVTNVHLGASDAPSLKGLVLGDQVTLAGRIDAGEDGARLASASVMTTQHYAGSDVQAPKFDGTNFLAAGASNAALPVIQLAGGDEHRSNVLVIDADMGVAHQGSVSHYAGSERFDATLKVQVYLQGGPTFQVDEGRVTDGDGRALEPRSTWVSHGADGDAHHGWYLHEPTNTLYALSFQLDADGKSGPAVATQGVELKAP